ncbi:MAG: hypothetical protein AAF830_15710 [Pseudomonadota bacterium]
MNMLAAFDETIEMARARGMPLVNDSSHESEGLSLSHLIDMRRRLENDDFSEAKLGRWLGWAQGVVVAKGYGTLDEMKQINLRNSN